jgi:hypothetical protein
MTSTNFLDSVACYDSQKYQNSLPTRSHGHFKNAVDRFFFKNAKGGVLPSLQNKFFVNKGGNIVLFFKDFNRERGKSPKPVNASLQGSWKIYGNSSRRKILFLPVFFVFEGRQMLYFVVPLVRCSVR